MEAVGTLAEGISGFDMLAGVCLRRPARPGSAIVDAGNRFLAAGAKWRPAPRLVRLICDAALEKTACPRL